MKEMIRTLGSALAALCIASAGVPAQAALGDPDCSFGTRGAFAITSAGATAFSAVLEPAGTLLVHGRSFPAAFLVRIDGDGKAIIKTLPSPSLVTIDQTDVVLPDGRIFSLTAAPLTLGNYTSSAGVTRLRADGTVDTAYGVNGSALVTGLLTNPVMSGVLVQADGRAIVAGTFNPGTTFPIDNTQSVAVLYRLSYRVPALHLWTTDLNEKDTLVAVYGWRYEGVVGEVLP